MPITPFHFGPGAALHALAPRHISFLSFCAANVLIDLESLYNLVNQHDPVHAFFHTYVGATIVIAVVVALFLGARWFSARFWLPNLLRWRELSLLQVVVGGTLGAYSHVVFDSVMHGDIRPLALFVPDNGLLGAVSLETLHIACAMAGALGLIGVLIRQLYTQRNAG